MRPSPEAQGRRVRDSVTEMAQLVLPHEANVHGSVLGGTVMHWIDLAAAVTANRHCRRPVVRTQVTGALREIEIDDGLLRPDLRLPASADQHCRYEHPTRHHHFSRIRRLAGA